MGQSADQRSWSTKAKPSSAPPCAHCSRAACTARRRRKPKSAQCLRVGNPKNILELCEIWSGGTPRKSVREYWGGKIPWVSGKDLKSPSLDDAIDHVTAEGVEAGSRVAPTESVLLLVRGMGLAKDLPVAVINRPMAFNQDVKALVSRGDYPGRFLRSAIYEGKSSSPQPKSFHRHTER